MTTNGLPKGMASFLWATGVTVVAAVGLSRLLFLNWLAGGAFWLLSSHESSLDVDKRTTEGNVNTH